VDEVVCGFGRTGRWFGSHTFDIAPDAMTMAKGLSSGYQPIAAVALAPRIGEAVYAADVELVHGFTYSGHPVACAVALENLAIMEEEGLHERASGPVGAHFRRALEDLADHPLVGEVRTCGLLGAIELVADRDGPVRFPPERRIGIACRERSLEEGLVMRAVRDIMVLAPPLVIDEAEIDELARRARRALDRTYDEVVRAG
jgi:putrescine---pyruvate transaminase